MNKVIFILGGARSGKSGFALKLAEKTSRNVAFIATCRALDSEMKERIMLHKKTRPKHWRTFEEPEDIKSVLEKIEKRFDVIIIDCLTILVSNLLLSGLKGKDIEKRIDRAMSMLKKIDSSVIIVSNEVGLGIVPGNKLARDFRDIAGRVNQLAADKADEVFFMVSGLPLMVKGEKDGPFDAAAYSGFAQGHPERLKGVEGWKK